MLLQHMLTEVGYHCIIQHKVSNLCPVDDPLSCAHMAFDELASCFVWFRGFIFLRIIFEFDLDICFDDTRLIELSLLWLIFLF